MKALITALATALVFSMASGANAADEKKKEPTAQQQKMASCNKDAGEKKLKGDERKSFMSSCLKGDADSGCEAKAVGKDGKKLGGAAKDSFMKKCEAEAKK